MRYEIALLLSSMVFAILLVVFAGHRVQYILATAPLFVSLGASYLIFSEYRARTTRAVGDDEDEDEAAAARRPTHMDITRALVCPALILVALLDMLRIALSWSVMVGFSFCTFSLALTVLLTVIVDEVGQLLGFEGYSLLFTYSVFFV